MAADTILCAASPGETRLALVEDGHVVELAAIRPGQAAGGIWLGRVSAVGRAGAFVDIGLARPGHLQEAAAEGEAVLVQALADPHGAKGARLTRAVSLSGRLLALSPLKPGVSASRRIEAAERERLLAIGRGLARAGEGFVIRSAAAGAAAEAIAAELERLRADWHAVQAAAAATRAPALLRAPDPLARMLADNPAVTRVLVDDSAAFAALRGRHGALIVREPDPFALFDADETLEQALAPLVPLPGGGSLIIEEAAAATLVDVNAGGADPDAANEAAVRELARQLRLRNLSGRILFDAIPTRRRRDGLLSALRRAVAADPVPTHVVGTTPLGLVETTRERRRASLAEVMLERRSEPSAETVALAALRALLRETARPGAPVVRAAPEVAAALAGLAEARAETERRLGRPFRVEADSGRGRHDVAIAWT